ncbi:MAG: discoidin domain-containing protein, partial [Candidatus Aureabacteria bacterium]|nr:discoidin domain-containing protein [Candidatus Auribacterota bacterium]
WTHPEIVFRCIPNAFKNGTRLVPGDLLRGFDCWSFDSIARARFLSYAVQIINAKFRVWLWEYLPPHPSLSLTWIFSLILSPLLLFKFLRNFARSHLSAWSGISLYILSLGFLSGITLLFHAGKPLTLFAAILSLYLSSRIDRLLARKEYFGKKVLQWTLLSPAILRGSPPGPDGGRGRAGLALVSKIRSFAKQRDRIAQRLALAYAGLIATVFISFFLDESAWFIFFCIPILYPNIFNARKNMIAALCGYALVFIFFLFFVTWIAPWVIKQCGFGDFKFWQCVWTPTYNQSSNIWQQFHFGNIVSNGRHLLGSLILPTQARTALRVEKVYTGAAIFLSVYAVVAFLQLPAWAKKAFLRATAVVLLFIIFQTAILAKHLRRIETPYYYGALFSLFVTLPFALLFSIRKEPFATLNQCLLVGLLIISIPNFRFINQASLANHGKSDAYGYPYFFPKEAKEMTGNVISRALVMEAWHQRRDRAALEGVRPRFPVGALWLFKELERRPPLAKDRLLSQGVSLAASSESPGGGEVKNLLDEDPDTFWHVAMDKIGQTAWLTVDFGAGRSRVVRSLTARPRLGHPEQFFRAAELLGSTDGKEWKTVSPIVQENPPGSEECPAWTVGNTQGFRYYRLAISDGHAGDKAHQIYSLAELEMLE